MFRVNVLASEALNSRSEAAVEGGSESGAFGGGGGDGFASRVPATVKVEQ